MARILLVRHGQSVWNAEGRWQGEADIELSDLGRKQAKAAAAKLGSFDVIATSPMLRASETAEIIAEQLGLGPVTPIPRLVERRAGPWSGLTRADIERDWPGFLADEKRPDGYELDDEMLPRVRTGLGEVVDLLPDPDASALVVAHGGVIYVLEGNAGRKAGRIPNLGALELTVDGHRSITVGHRVHLIDEAELRSAQSRQLL